VSSLRQWALSQDSLTPYRVTLASPVLAGSLLVGVYQRRNTGATTITPTPAGWTPLTTNFPVMIGVGASGCNMGMFWKVATGLEGVNIDAEGGNGDIRCNAVLEFLGNWGAAPALGDSKFVDDTQTIGTITAPAVAVPAGRDVLIVVGASCSNRTFRALPSALTELWDQTIDAAQPTVNPSAVGGYRILPAIVGPTVSHTITWSTSPAKSLIQMAVFVELAAAAGWPRRFW